MVVLIKNPFVDGDGRFLCLQIGRNSPQKNNSITSLIFISKHSKLLDNVDNNLQYFLNFKISLMLELFMGLKLET